MRGLDFPPVWLLVCLFLSWWAPVRVAFPGLTALGWGLVALGALLTLAAALEFWRAGTSIVPRHAPRALITGGVFRLSRNPIYLADLLVLAGFSLIWGSVLGVVLVPAFAVLLERRFIRGEEAALKAAFPEAFANYSQSTRRWF